MGITNWDAPVYPNLAHPDSIIRLTTTILRFRCPEIEEKSAKELSFTRSFSTVANDPVTASILKEINMARKCLHNNLTITSNSGVSHKTIVNAAQTYIPLIQKVLITCKVHPEDIRLTERLLFSWTSGIEENKRFFPSEAITYELVMTIATQGIATCGIACDECTAGNFVSASRQFKKAAGIMKFLATELLPEWRSYGDTPNADEKTLPAEASIDMCEALHILFLALAQQMAVAIVLIKPGIPSYSLLAKICMGIVEQLQEFGSILGSKAPNQKQRMDHTFIPLTMFQVGFQKGLSMYFLARHTWGTKEHYGLAISMMREAISLMNTRESHIKPGLPDVTGSSLQAIEKDIIDMRQHMVLVRNTWEKDNMSVYFDKIPRIIPEEEQLQASVHMMTADKYSLEDVEPLQLNLNAQNPQTHTILEQEQSDRDIAMRLQKQLDMEEHK